MPRLSQLFAPKEREFFDLFEEAGSNIVRAAELLERMLDQWPDHGELARDVVVCEQEGDRITHDIIQRLNTTFVTPIDREDIYALASAMDDIVDFIEEIADFLALYRIEAPMEQSQALARILLEASRLIAQAVPRLRTFNDIRLYYGYQRFAATNNWMMDIYGGVALRSRRMLIVHENLDLVNKQWTYTIEEKDDVVPAFFLGIKVGLGW